MIRRNLIIASWTFVGACIVVTGILAGCASTHVDSPFQRQLDSLGVTSNALRAKNIDRAVRIGLLIEVACDSILDLSDDHEVEQNARQWRSYAIPGIRHALSFSDPATATLDGWAFAIQQKKYLTTGEGRLMFGPQQGIAIRAAAIIEELFAAGHPFEDGGEAFRVRIQDWADSHLIKNDFFERESLIPSLKALNINQGESVGSSVGEIANDLRDVSNRLSLYTAQLPREIRWQGEYLLEELQVENRLDSLNALVSGMVEAVDQLTKTMNDGELIVDVHGLRELREDILLLKQQISTERELLMADVNRQRVETMREAERMTRELMKEFRTPAKDLIDYVLFRMMIAALIVLAIVLALMFWLRRRTIT